jgi:hypothetical protein
MTHLQKVTKPLAVVFLGAIFNSGLVMLAHADTVDLICIEGGVSSSNDWFITIDTNASTVTAGYTRYDRKTVAAAPAKITDDQVTWAEPVNASIRYLLDRRTGTFTRTGDTIPMTCTKASRAF